MWNKIKISKIQSFSFFLFFPFIVSGCDFLNREVDSFKNRLEVLYCSRPNINDGINGGSKYNLKPLEINVSTLERYVFNKDNKVETWTDRQSVPYDLLSPSRGGSITIGELSEGKYGYLYVIIFDKINGKTYYYDYEKCSFHNRKER